jgi:hypothetical protein
MKHEGYMDLIDKLVSGRMSRTEFERITINQKQYLMGLIDTVVSGKISVTQFHELYYPFVLELLPDVLSERDEEFFEMVRQKLEWTAEKPDPESIKYGWLNHKQFVEWLREKRDWYLNNDAM